MKNKGILNKSKLFVIILIICSACSEDLLDKTPISSAAGDNFFLTPNDFETAVNGIYDGLQSNSYYGDFWRYVMEHRSDNIDDNEPGRQAGAWYEINKFQESASNVVLRDVWSAMYVVISRSNEVLSRIDGIAMDEALRTKLTGEARFLRALTYFNLTRLWGEVPLITSNLDPETIRESASRNSVSEVYMQIEDDLQAAISNLPSGAPSGLASSEAATVLLAKVRMTLGNFNDALPLLESLDLTSLIPLDQIWDISNELNDEMIFVVSFQSSITAESHPAWYSSAESEIVSADLFDAYEQSDLRDTLIYGNNDLGGLPIPIKYREAPVAGGQYGSDCPVIRKAEAVLLKAEALNEIGYVADGEAFDLLNLVRTRAGISNLTSSDLPDQASFRSAIFEERRLEFALEGQRWFDLQRSGMAQSELAEVGIDFQSYQLLFPVPQTEIDAFQDVSRFPQNPGY